MGVTWESCQVYSATVCTLVTVFGQACNSTVRKTCRGERYKEKKIERPGSNEKEWERMILRRWEGEKENEIRWDKVNERKLDKEGENIRRE